MYRYGTALGESVEMFEFKEPDAPAGLSAYMFSDRFVRKIQPFLAGLYRLNPVDP